VFEWDGWTMNGERAEAGTYSFEVTATNANGDAITATPFILGVADGVQYQNGQAYIVIDGASVALGDVIEVGALMGQTGSNSEIVSDDENDDEDDDNGNQIGSIIHTPVEPEDVIRG